MKKVIRFLIISLAPTVMLIAYSNLYFWARVYTGKYYDMLPLFITIVAGFALIGSAIFLICRQVLKETNTARIPFEFLVGIVLVIFPMLSLFVHIPLPFFLFPDMGTGMSITGLFVGIYICLFITVLRRRDKVRNQQKAEQNIEPFQ